MLKKKRKTTSSADRLAKKSTKIKKNVVKKKKLKLGEPVERTNKTNCLVCERYLKCKDPSKAPSFACSRFESIFAQGFLQVQDGGIIKAEKTRSKAQDALDRASDAITAGEDHNKFDFGKLVDEVIAAEKISPIPRDLVIDDRDFKQAPNFYSFVTDKNYIDIRPFGKQLQVGTMLFGEYCPRCSNPDYVQNVPVKHRAEKFIENVQLLDYGVCKKCKATRSELHKSREIDVHSEFIGLVGQRAGKSFTTGLLLAYHNHAYIKLQNPAKVFGLAPGQELYSQLTALTWYGARDLLWKPVLNNMMNSPWFQGYHEMLSDLSEQKGIELFKLKDTFYINRARNLYQAPFVPDRNKLRGRTSYSCGVDELGLMDNSEGNSKIRDNAKEIHRSLKNALFSVRTAYYALLKRGQNGVLPPMLCCVSSPLNKKDKIVSLHEEAQNSRRMYAIHYATWEYNPGIKLKDLEEEFNNDSITIMRDFGAVPPNSAKPYITDLEQVAGCVSTDVMNKLTVLPALKYSESGSKSQSGKVSFKAAKDQNKRVLAIDAGSTKNSFAFAGGYYSEEFEMPVFDIVGEIIPDGVHSLNHTMIYDDVISKIIEWGNVQMLVADRWNSLKILTDAEKQFGIQQEQYSVKYTDFVDFKDEIINGHMIIPKPEMKRAKVERAGEEAYPFSFAAKPVAHMTYQLITVQDLTKEVIKGPGSTDDILRAMVLANSYLIDPKYQELFTGQINKAIASPGVIAVWGSRGASGYASAGSGGFNGIGIVSSLRNRR